MSRQTAGNLDWESFKEWVSGKGWLIQSRSQFLVCRTVVTRRAVMYERCGEEIIALSLCSFPLRCTTVSQSPIQTVLRSSQLFSCTRWTSGPNLQTFQLQPQRFSSHLANYLEHKLHSTYCPDVTGPDDRLYCTMNWLMLSRSWLWRCSGWSYCSRTPSSQWPFRNC